MHIVRSIFRAFRPKFSCELSVAMTRDDVTERIRRSLRTGMFRDRIGQPFVGDIGAAIFKIALDARTEDSPIFVEGQIEETDGMSHISIVAKQGMSNTVGPFLFGFIACLVVMTYFDIGVPGRVFVATIGGTAFAVPLQRSNVRHFWEGLDDVLVELQYILEASMISRSHNRYGVQSSPVNQEAKHE